ncbi:MAG: RdgB/HAM1 family non-canonical purine NTP pyrophosphatase [Spirochaetaceae bacterium]|jgi:XTP/dITP diphosphohydrolase|nr:RdgB/HAM1 family non-canonical purine NTP pyrophosphatase [Spirochaetaceae bacterium]
MLIWFATGNEHKRRELASILPETELRIPSDAGIDFEPDENGETFLENALIKAKALYRIVREPVIADDSGLCVDALGGGPGVRSARYGAEDGRRLDAAARNALLLRELGNETNRAARFVCAMTLLFDEYRFFAAQETLEGELLREQRGLGGFGYDPVLYLPDRGCTVAELPEDIKNRLSHRARAADALRVHLGAVMGRQRGERFF